MFIKKYLLLLIFPLFLSAESIVGKWEINAQDTEQSIRKLSINENLKQFLLLLSSKGFKFLECYEDKTCIQNSLTDIDSCMGHFQWEQNNNNYILTPYTDKLCPNAISTKKLKITTDSNELKLLMGNGDKSSYFIYNKISSTTSKKPLNYLTKIQYNKIYKSKAIGTYVISRGSTVPTYFYLFFSDKNKFNSVVTTQSNISSIDKLKKIIHIKSEEYKKEFKMSLEDWKNKVKNMPYTHDTDVIEFTDTSSGSFDSNKNGIFGYFNSYHKESDVKNISDKNGFGFSFKDRICEQITFKPNNMLSCNNGIQYTLLDKSSSVEKQTVQKASASIIKEHIENIDIETEKHEVNKKMDKELQDAIQDVM